MTELRVLGIGSPFGDDQLGWEVVKLLQQKASLRHYIPHQLHLTCCDRPGMYLLELMRHAKTVFLIDAVITGATIGTLHCFKNEDIKDLSSTLSTHGLGIAEAMQMGAVLQELPKHITLYGAEIEGIQQPFSLSNPIKDAIESLAQRLETDILSALTRPA